MRHLLDSFARAWSTSCVAALIAALMLFGAPMMLSACTSSAPSEEGSSAAEPEESKAETSQDADASESQTEEAEAPTWEEYCKDNDLDADRCLARGGVPTAYALWMLPGKQLDGLLQDKGFVWSERNLMWLKSDGSVVIYAVNAEGQPCSRDELADTCPAASADEDATFAHLSYRIASSRYNTPKKAFDALVSNCFDQHDAAYAELSGVGLFCPKTEAEVETEVEVEAQAQAQAADNAQLAFINTSDDVVVVSLYSKQAVANGVFSDLVGQDMGATPAEVFESLAGRAPQL